ncbi:hypothetical protein [Qipengyuania atrilutea]|uniref:Tyr recombinase domain-containing protein n=1 Tax=Qipengyuania atrilutea TaxID=2744473 RepID=A0A850H1C6_9SPHN|nr:hypothetical protein [Actirhodobacter atriluteus]NVD44320.1 hypothetical protein [Actirhodobacter atriluteus]
MYLTKNRHGVYYYRRPIIAEDQKFWRGPQGGPKREWNVSLRTKERREAVLLLADAADSYEAERAAQLAAHLKTVAPSESEREREERLAAEAEAAASAARKEARAEYRIERRRRALASTAELSPQEAAWHDIVREKDAEIASLRAAAEGQRAVNDANAGPLRTAHPSSDSTHTVEALLTAYEADKSPLWGGSSKKAVKPVFRLLRDLFADREVASITRKDARDVVDLLRELPTQIGKRKETAGKPIRDAVAVGRKLGLPVLQPKTINDGYLSHISSIFGWAVREQWVQFNPFTGLTVHDPVADEDRRDPFTPVQLQTLLSQHHWAAPFETETEKPGAFWVPLLCLFHGLRNGEAAGLRVEDIGEDEGHPVLHIRPYDGRGIKTESSRGTLPIHPEIIRLGFLQYVQHRAARREVLLFPEGIANGRGQVAAKLGERFSLQIGAML